MESARKNVTEISQFARARGKQGVAARTPLDDSREISALRLGEALSESLALVAGQLLGMAEKAAGLDLYHLYMDAMELARDRAGPVGEDFREQYLWRFNRECRREGGHNADGLNAELSLLEPDDLEQSLAAGTLANAIFNACSEELFGLGKRIGLLIDDPDLLRGDNPLGPEVIGAAVMAALERQASSIKVRLLLVSLLSRHLPERVRDIYRDVNRKLVERNVLPTIRVGLKRQERATPGQTGATELGGPSAPVGGNDLFGVLRQLLGGVTPSVAGSVVPAVPFIAGPAMPGEAANAEAGQVSAAVASDATGLRPGTFLYALDQLQHGRPEGVTLAGLDAAALSDGQVNVLRGLRGGGLAGLMGPLDVMTLDIVAMVFDYILDDDRIPDAIKALIGRLQIPVLKVAMLDKGFFSQKSHPARRLLDGLADAALGWNDEEGRESGLYRKIEELVTGVLDGYEADLAVFETACAGLETYLAEEKQVADRSAARSALAIRSQEEADLGGRVARDEVESSLVGRPVPAVIRAFLFERWSTLLTGLYRKVGVDSETWKGAVATMNDLVWSVAPKTGTEERRRLVEMLPGLLKRLDEGIQCLGLDEAVRNAFFSSLVKCHAEAVKSGLADEGGEAADEAESMAGYGDIPVLETSADFVPVEPVAEADLPALVEVLAGEAVPAVEEITIAALEWSPDDTLPPPAPGLGLLKRGSWIAYRQDDGAEVRAKLSWISPMKGIYLFTNRQGQRAMSINADGLAAKLASGEVRVLDAAPLVERAVDNLMETLKRNAA